MDKQNNFRFSFDSVPETDVSIASFQHTGSRNYQEDSYDFTGPLKSASGDECFIAVLSDGMGGLSQGDKVSKYVVSSYIKLLSGLRSYKDIHKQFTAMTAAINNDIVKGGTGGGATAVAVYCCRKGVFFCSTGDSRLYLFRNSILTQLTEDADVMNRELIKVIDGLATYSDAYNNSERDSLTEFIGANKQLSPDVNIKPLEIQPGDKLLLCSDGVYNAIPEKDLSGFLSMTPHYASTGMKNAIDENKTPAQDNATAIVIEFR